MSAKEEDRYSEQSYMMAAQNDFSRAYRKRFFHAIIAWIQKSNNDLIPYDEVRKRIPMRGQHYVGLQQVETDKIVGSVSRFNDFDRAFLPRQTHTRSRWESIDRAYFSDVILPPIDVYKIGDVYFVKDGNHRVSVARERGQVYMDAYVIEMDIPGTLDASVKLDDLVMVQEYAEFLNATRLDQLYPGQDFKFSIPGQYEKLLQHISVHQWFMGEARQHPIEYEEAVKGWYNELYKPLIKIIRSHKILKNFPGRTETDLYLWIIEHRWYLAEEKHRAISLEAAALHFTQGFSQKPFRHIHQLFNWLFRKKNKKRQG